MLATPNATLSDPGYDACHHLYCCSMKKDRTATEGQTVWERVDAAERARPFHRSCVWYDERKSMGCKVPQVGLCEHATWIDISAALGNVSSPMCCGTVACPGQTRVYELGCWDAGMHTSHVCACMQGCKAYGISGETLSNEKKHRVEE